MARRAAAAAGKIAILAGAGVEHSNAAPALRAIRRTLADSGRDDFAREGRASRGPSAVARRLRLCRHASFPHGSAGCAARSSDRARLRTERTRHDALVAAASGPGATICVNLSLTSIGLHAQDSGVVGDCGAYLAILLERTDDLRPCAADNACGARGVAVGDSFEAPIAGHRKLRQRRRAYSSGARHRRVETHLSARRHLARRFRRASRLRRPLLGSLRTAHLYFGDKSRSDGLGHSGRKSACNARSRSGASPSSPATAACA